MNKILVLGYGLLGKELVKQTNWDYLSRSKTKDFNFTDVQTYKELISKYKTIINCIGFTDTYSSNSVKHWNTNYKAVADLVNVCNINKQKLVHISTDYLYSGSNEEATENDIPIHNKTWYGYSKLLGDAHVQLKSDNYLIIRSGHKANPFTFDKAFDDIIGNFDYVNRISSLIICLINNNAIGIKNVGTKVKSMYDLALETKSNVKKSKCDNDLMPKNVSMRIKK